MLNVSNYWEQMKYFNDFNITVTSMGYVEADSKGWGFSDFSATFNKLYYMKNGSITVKRHTSNTQKDVNVLLPGNAYIIPCKNIYDFSTDESFSKYFLGFNIISPIGNDIFDDVKNIYNIEFDISKLDEIKAGLSGGDFLSILRFKRIAYDTITDIIIQNNLNVFSNSFDTTEKYSEIVASAVKYICENLKNGLTVKEVARYIGMTPANLNRHFINSTGKTVKEYIMCELTKSIQYYLMVTNMSVKEVAAILEFSDQYNFSKFCKKRFYDSPLELRKNNWSLRE